MGIGEKIENWLFGIALKKGVKAVVTLIVAFLASEKIAPILTQIGISIDSTQLTLYLTALATAGLTMFLNYIKVKTKTKLL